MREGVNGVEEAMVDVERGGERGGGACEGGSGAEGEKGRERGGDGGGGRGGGMGSPETVGGVLFAVLGSECSAPGRHNHTIFLHMTTIKQGISVMTM